MSADLDNRSPGANDESSKFTAVNGRSPPSSNGNHGFSAAESAGSNKQFGDPNIRRESVDSLKRKRTESVHSSGSSTSSAKRQRASPSSLPNGDPSPNLSNGTPKSSNHSVHHTPNGSISHSLGDHDRPRSHDETDYRLLQAFGRDGPQGQPAHVPPRQPSPPPKYPQHGLVSGQHGLPPPGQQVPPGLPPAPMPQKQRKRNFANRTKTGCLTCRERKKKCDENKPTCINCERGGFSCKGYSQTGPNLKSTPGRDHHPIQAKHGRPVFDAVTPASFPPRHMAPAMGPPPQPGPPPPPHHGPPPPGMYHPPPPDHDPRRVMPMHEPPRDHPRAVADSGVLNYGRPAWAEAHGPPFAPEAMRPDYPYLPMDQSRDHKRLPPPQGASMPPPPPNSYSTSMPSPYNHASTTAKLALEHSSSQQPLPPPPPYHAQSEKAKMLNHEPFNRNDPELKSERRKCEQRVSEFNKAITMNPDHYTDTGKTELVRKIIQPDLEQSPGSLHGMCPKNASSGHLGERVEVEAPFYCHYGYNIRIGDDTEIGRHCEIGDSCTVRIGARCVLGPGVTFCTEDGTHHMPRPPNVKRLSVARPIHVGDDVFIGAGSVILAGASIEHGCAVGAGTIVRGHCKAGNIVINENQMRFPKGQWGR